MNPGRRAVLDQIVAKKWKLSKAKDVRDRSAPNLMLWKEEKGYVAQGYANKLEDKDKYMVNQPAQAGQKTFVPVSTQATNPSSSSSGTGPILTHHHDELNSAFPVQPGLIRRHEDIAGESAFRGASFGEKIKNAGKDFSNWIKEEATEVKQSFKHMTYDSKTHEEKDMANLGAGSQYVSTPSNVHNVPSTNTLQGSSSGTYGSSNVGISNVGYATNKSGESMNQELPTSKPMSGSQYSSTQ